MTAGSHPPEGPAEVDTDLIAEHETLHPPGEPEEGARVDDLVDESRPLEGDELTGPDEEP